MKLDVLHLVGAVVREVRNRDYNGSPARAVVATCAYDTTVPDLWDAISNPERIPRWFLPISGDLRRGGRFQLQGNAAGEILRCEPPREFEVTWEAGGELSWVQVQLQEQADGRALLRLEHIAPVVEDRWQQFGPGAVGVGWDLALMGLSLHLSTGAVVDPQQAMMWMASDEGKNFVRRSSQEWGAASVSAGTNPTAAAAAAERTTAAYLGEG
jgi:uncharacterized protein YndB with AHSA1/START domain